MKKLFYKYLEIVLWMLIGFVMALIILESTINNGLPIISLFFSAVSLWLGFVFGAMCVDLLIDWLRRHGTA